MWYDEDFFSYGNGYGRLCHSGLWLWQNHGDGWWTVGSRTNPYKMLNYFQFVSNISTLTYSKSIRLFLIWNMHKTTLYSAYSFLWNQHLIRLYRIKIVAARKISKNMASTYFFIFKFWNLFPQSFPNYYRSPCLSPGSSLRTPAHHTTGLTNPLQSLGLVFQK